MKGRVLIVLLVSFYIMPNSMLAGENVRLANGEFVPYSSKTLKHFGFFSRIVTEAFAREGIRVEYEFFPWKRSFVYAKKGQKFDGTLVWFWTPDRAQYFHFSDPIANSTFVFFHLSTVKFDWETIEDLKGVRIGATLQYNYGEEFQLAEKKGGINVQRVPTDTANFKKMLARRIDIFPVDIEVGYSILHGMYEPEVVALFTHNSKPIRSEPFYLLLSKKGKRSKHLLPVFNKGLAALKSEGKIDQYIEESRRGEYKIK